MASSDSRRARKLMERELERGRARAECRIKDAALDDPDWHARARASWKRLVSGSPDDRETSREFDEILKEKGLL